MTIRKRLHRVKASTRKKVRIVLFAILIVLLGLFFLQRQMHGAKPDPNLPAASGDVDNLISFSLHPGSQVYGVMKVTGSLRGGYFFEGVAQGMLLDANHAVLVRFPLQAKSLWTTADGVAFSATIDASNVPLGPGYIRLANDNPSGEPSLERFIDIPVVFIE